MMSEITLNSTQLKNVLKSAIIEILQENREAVEVVEFLVKLSGEDVLPGFILDVK